MTIFPRYVSSRFKDLKVGISSYSEDRTALEVIGNVGVGTTNPDISVGVGNTAKLAVGILTANNVHAKQYFGDNNGNFNALNAGSGQVGIDSGAICNILIGNGTGQCITSGKVNILMGLMSGCDMTTGSHNIGLGYNSIRNVTSGGCNIAIGRKAGRGTREGIQNIYLGGSAGASNTSGSYNISMGYLAEWGSINSTRGRCNIIMGSYAGAQTFQAGDRDSYIGNIFLGSCVAHGAFACCGPFDAAHMLNSTFGHNIVLGDSAGCRMGSAPNHEDVIENVYLGRSSAKFSLGGCNVLLGSYANTRTGPNPIAGLGLTASVGNLNIGIGHSVCLAKQIGSRQLAIGHSDFQWIHGDCDYNVGVGITNPSRAVTSSDTQKLAVGILTAHNVFANQYRGDENNNFYAGPHSGSGAAGIANGATLNIGIGQSTGSNITSGSCNILLGICAGLSVTTGKENILLGKRTGEKITSGNYNSLFGRSVGCDITTGSFNIGMGYQPLRGLTTGRGNIGIGLKANALLACGAKTSDYNIAIGDQSGEGRDASGNDNIMIGRRTLNIMSSCTTTNDHNIAIGCGAGYALGASNHIGCNISNNILIGCKAGFLFNRSIGAGNTESMNENILIGMSAGFYGRGTCNIFIGSCTGGIEGGCSQKIHDGHDNIGIGQSVTLPKLVGSNQLAIGQKGNYWITGDCNYNVGIGSTIPQTKLDVGGAFNVSGVSTFGGGAQFRAPVVIGRPHACEPGVPGQFAVHNANFLRPASMSFTGGNLYIDPTIQVRFGKDSNYLRFYSDCNTLSDTAGRGNIQFGYSPAAGERGAKGLDIHGHGSIIMTVANKEAVGIGSTVADVTLSYDGSPRLMTSGIGVTIFNQLDTTDFNVAGVSTFAGAIDANGTLDVDGHTELDDVNVSGAATFAGSASFAGNVSIGGTLTYEDVTNVDSIGIITAGNGLRVTQGGINVNSGVSTFKDDVEFHGVSGVSSITFDKSDNSLKFKDNSRLRFGDDNRFQIYYKDNINYIMAEKSPDDIQVGTHGGDIIFQTVQGAQTAAVMRHDSSVDLYYNCVNRFATSSIGATVYGQLDVTDLNATGVVTARRYRGDENHNFFAGPFVGSSSTESTLNIGIGKSIGFNLTTGNNNVLLGDCVGAGLSAASHNIFLGAEAGKSVIDSPNCSILIGRSAGCDMVTGSTNIGIGCRVYRGETGGNSNIAIGSQAGRSFSTATATNQYAISIGVFAGRTSVQGSGNISIGCRAGEAQMSCTTGNNDNIAIGINAGYQVGGFNYVGCHIHSNIMIGCRAGMSANYGPSNKIDENILIGTCAFTYGLGACNIYIGPYAGCGYHLSQHYGDSNIGIGLSIAMPNRFGSNQLAIGQTSQYWIVGDSSFNVGIGTTIPTNPVTSGNTQKLAVGILTAHQVFGQVFLGTSGSETGGTFTGGNVAFGNTFTGNTFDTTSCLSNYNNISIGNCTGCRLNGNSNILLGEKAGNNVTTGKNNIIMGRNVASAGVDLTGSNNIVLGKGSGAYMTSARNNIIMGENTTGSFQTGYENILIGCRVAQQLSNGISNVFLGPRAGYGVTNGCCNVFIGNAARPTESDVSNCLVIGGLLKSWIYGDCDYNVGIGITNPSVAKVGAGDTQKLAAGIVTSYNIYSEQYYGGENDNFYGKGAGSGQVGITSGAKCNIGIGRSALSSLLTGYRNIAFGCEAGLNVTSGRDNLFVGFEAGCDITSGIHNLAIGSQALLENKLGCYNVGLGIKAGRSNPSNPTDASICNKYNTYIGHAAGDSQAAGDGNVNLGYSAFRFSSNSGGTNVTGNNNNIAIGCWAASYIQGCEITNNVIVGPYAGRDTANGPSNTFRENVLLGACAGHSSRGSCNIFLGSCAGKPVSGCTNGDRNIGIGQSVVMPKLVGSNQLAIGQGTKYWIVGDSDYNVGIGTTIPTNKVTSGNTQKLAVGILTAHHVFANQYRGDENNNFYVGVNAGSGAAGITSGAKINIGIGESTGAKITSGYGNLILGARSGCEITTGHTNTIVGCNGLRSLTTGSLNIAIGAKPGRTQVSGVSNIYMGLNSGLGKTDGQCNIEIGTNAGWAVSGQAASSGCHNIFFGTAAGMNMYFPGGDVSSFTSNIYIGRSAGFFQVYDNTSEVRRNIFMGECTGHTFGGCWVPNYDRPVDNVVIGSLAARFNSGAHNVFLGSYVNNRAGVGFTYSAACYSIGIGHSVCLAKHQGDRQLAIGHSDYQWIIGDCDYNVGIGTTIPTNAVNSGNTQKLAVGILTAHNVFANQYHGDENNNFYAGAFTGSGALGIANGARCNIAIGHSSGSNITSGGENILIGRCTGFSQTSAFTNTLIGACVGRRLTTGGGNIGFGRRAFDCVSTGLFNIAMGFRAGRNRQSEAGFPDPNYNISIGHQAADVYFYGGNCRNIYLGMNAADNLVQGDSTSTSCVCNNDNILIGSSVANNIVVCGEFCRNILIGDNAGFNALGAGIGTDYVQNVLIGTKAGSRYNGTCNIFLGAYAGCSPGNLSPRSTGIANIGIGLSVQMADRFGSNQLAIGQTSQYWITGDSSFNVGIGSTIPQSKLDVGGALNVSGVSTFGDDVQFREFVRFGKPQSEEDNVPGKFAVYNGNSLFPSRMVYTGGNLHIEPMTEVRFGKPGNYLTFSSQCIATGGGQAGRGQIEFGYLVGQNGPKGLDISGHGSLLLKVANKQGVGIGSTVSDVTLSYNGSPRLMTSGIGVTIFNQLDTTDLNISGVGTFASQLFVGGLEVTGGATVGQDITTRHFKAIGISTFSGNIDANANADISGNLVVGGTINSGDNITITKGIPTLHFVDTNADDFQIRVNNNIFSIRETSGLVNRFQIDSGRVYLPDNLVVNQQTSLTNLNVSGVSTFSDDIKIPLDDKKLIVGADNDLELFHTGGNSVIKNTTSGSLLIHGNTIDLRPTTESGEVMLRATRNGSVELRHDNVKKFETTNTGINVTGDVVSSGNGTFSGNVSIGGTLTYEDVTNIDSVGIVTARKDVHVGAGLSVVGVSTFNSRIDALNRIDIGSTSSTGRIRFHNGTSHVFTVGNIGGNLTLRSANGAVQADDNIGRKLFFGSPGGAFRIYHGGGQKLTTKGTGINVTGEVESDGLVVDGHSELDNVNIAGVSTFADDIFVGTGATVGFGSTAFFEQKVFIADDNSFNIGRTKTLSTIYNSQFDVIFATNTASQMITATDGFTVQNIAGQKFIKATSTNTGLYHVGTQKLRTSTDGIQVVNNASGALGTMTALNVDTTFLKASGVSTFSDNIFVGTGATVGFGSTAFFKGGGISFDEGGGGIKFAPAGGVVQWTHGPAHGTNLTSFGYIPDSSFDFWDDIFMILDQSKRFQIGSSGIIQLGSESGGGVWLRADNQSTRLYHRAVYTDLAAGLKLETNGIGVTVYNQLDTTDINASGIITATKYSGDAQENFYAGTNAGSNSDSDTCRNVAIGFSAGSYLNSGDHNVFLGSCAGTLSQSSMCNVSIGHRAGFAIGMGTANVSIGDYAGQGNVSNAANNTVAYNVSLGAFAQFEGVTAHNNVSLGCAAHVCNRYGTYNVAIGHSAGACSTHTCHNILMGAQAGLGLTSGYNNVAIGRYAGSSRPGETPNVGGSFAGGDTFDNVSIGHSAGSCMTSSGNYIANRNVYIGRCAGIAATTSCYNTVVGADAGIGMTSRVAYSNVLLGFCAGRCVTGSRNIAIGQIALDRLGPLSSSNIGIGYKAGRSFGDKVTYSNLSIGHLAGDAYYTGCRNTILGHYAGRNIENYCADDLMNDNTIIGSCAAMSMQGQHETFENVILGYKSALYARGLGISTAFSRNVILGSCAGAFMKGSCNIFIGPDAARSPHNFAWHTCGDSNIGIGQSVQMPNRFGSNQLAIGQTSQYWITGDESFNVGIGSTTPQAKLDVVGGANIDQLNVAGVSTFAGDLNISSSVPQILLTDTDNDSDYAIRNANGVFEIKDTTNNSSRLKILSNGITTVEAPLNVNGNFITSGTASVTGGSLQISGTAPFIGLNDSDHNPDYRLYNINGEFQIYDSTNASVRFNIKNNKVGIGTNNPARDFHVEGTSRFDQLDVVGFSTFGGSGTKFFHHVPRVEMQGSNTAQFQLTNATSGTTLNDGMVMGFSSGSKAGFINVNESAHGFILKTGGNATSAERINISGVGTVSIRKGTAEEMITARPDGAVELFYDNVKRLSTSSIGATVFGQLDTTDLNASGVVTATSFVGALPIANDANNRVITATGSGGLNAENNVTYDGNTFLVGAEFLTLTGTGYKQLTAATTTNNSASIKLQNSAKNYNITNVAGGTFQIAEAGVGRFQIVNGNVSIINSDLNVSGVVTATDFDATSDIRLKTNIKPIDDPIAKVIQIEGVSFNWKKDNQPALGVIADQVEKILPELVHGDDPKTVNYNGLIGLLIEVVKDQQKQINTLSERISKLE